MVLSFRGFEFYFSTNIKLFSHEKSNPSFQTSTFENFSDAGVCFSLMFSGIKIFARPRTVTGRYCFLLLMVIFSMDYARAQEACNCEGTGINYNITGSFVLLSQSGLPSGAVGNTCLSINGTLAVL
ncbi:MAG: hypothetical protein IPK76_19885 [Lewinellaceae bacterium]|nr:hypothetical protein [Lewinellaceae bacterium]